VADAFIKVITTVDLSAYDIGPRNNMLIVDKAKRGKVFVIDPKNNPSMGQIPADTNGYTVVNSSWHNYSEYLAFFTSKQLAKPVGSFLYNPSTGKFFMMTVNTPGPITKPARKGNLFRTPGELWVDPQGKPIYPEPTPTAKILAEWDKALVAVGKKELAVKAAEMKKGRPSIDFLIEYFSHKVRFIGALDDGRCNFSIGPFETFKMRLSAMSMDDRCRLAQAFARERKDKQAMAVAAFYTLANAKLDLAKKLLRK
jgi:hypothetical protein